MEKRRNLVLGENFKMALGIMFSLIAILTYLSILFVLGHLLVIEKINIYLFAPILVVWLFFLIYGMVVFSGINEVGGI